MKLTLTVPRSRADHLAAIPAPEGCESPILRLHGKGGVELVAERDPSLPVYHATMPAIAAGEAARYDVDTSDGDGTADGITTAQEKDKVDVSLSGASLMTFHGTAEYPKPVINPILTPGGTNMLREPTPAYSEGEHPWQRGLTLMQGAINGVDCWNEVDRDEFGRTAQDRMEVRHGPLSMTIASENTWYQGDRPLMTDQRSYRLFDTSRDAAVLDIVLTAKATHGPVVFGGTKEAGFLCIRVNPSMNADGNGRMRNAYGATDEEG